MANTTAAHEFFYSDGGFYNRRSPEAFCNDLFFSYSTCIAKKTKTKDGRRILLLSKDKFSSTTSKHIAALKYACYWDIIEIPQTIDRSDFDYNEVLETLYSNLIYIAGESLTLKRNREEFNYNYETLKSLANIEGFKVDKKVLKRYKNIYEKINNPEELKKLKAKQRAAEKKQQDQLKKQLENWVNSYNIMQLAQIAYTGKNFEEKAALKKYINPQDDLSFVWFDGDFVRTSQGIAVDRSEVEKLLHLWQLGKITTGMNVSRYSILEITSEFVRIGCHKIPMENINVLVEVIKEQPQAA